MNWRRFDTLGLRLFLLMWVTLVASHLVAFLLAVPLAEPGGGPAAGRLTQLPTLPSLPPGNPFQTDATGPGGPGSPGGPPPGEPPQPGTRPPPSPAPGGNAPALPSAALWWDYGIRLLVIALGAALGARWLAEPMRRLSRAAGALAQGFAAGQPPPQLNEQQGTQEVRATARVFNRMARRLQEQFDARSLHMAATSHDLRTPLTRLRMRLESMPDPAAAAAIADIHEMDALIDSALAVLREQRDAAAPSAIDLGALLQSVVDDLAEQGQAVVLAAVPSARVRAHPAALRRIVDNLVGNALRHGGAARLSVQPLADGVALWVDDDGPGIPPELIEQVFQPWVRLGAGAASSGHGLGLAIARDLAERDGGRLTLANRAEGGLRATLVLPAAFVSGST
jgi:protein-histidine pros-kinase